MPDCILGYHLTPFTCGIARFNHALGQELGIPVLSLFAAEVDSFSHVLLSIKISEFNGSDTVRLAAFLARRAATQRLDLFLHDYADTPIERDLVAAADSVIVGNARLAAEPGLRHAHPIEAWCPGALMQARPFAETDITIFSFGMAHKLRGERYQTLKQILDRCGRSYAINLSTALHEGSSFEQGFTAAHEEMSVIFGDQVNFLGFLSDAAVFNQLRSCSYFAAFFPDGVRANNTSVHTAMQCGAVVITNLDEHSPPEYRHGANLLDIDQLDSLPLEPAELAQIGARARAAADHYGWGPLATLIKGIA